PHRTESTDGRAHPDQGEDRREVPRRQGCQGRNCSQEVNCVSQYVIAKAGSWLSFRFVQQLKFCAPMLNWILIGIGDIATRRVIPAIQSEPRSSLYGLVTLDPAKAAPY